MREQRFALIPLDPKRGTIAPGLTLPEAFTRLMALAGRDYMFFRTGAWVMHLAILPPVVGEPAFESSLSIDSHARAAIMRQICDHGLGLFRMVPDEQHQQKRITHDRVA